MSRFGRSLCVALLIGAASAVRVHPRDVDSITLHAGRFTASRRVVAVPQLAAVSVPPGNTFLPSVVRCVNDGWDGKDIQWTCTADLPSDLRFGPTVVSCEGYDSPDDEYILAGSCGLEYELQQIPIVAKTTVHEHMSEDGIRRLILLVGLISVAGFVGTIVCCVSDCITRARRQPVAPRPVYYAPTRPSTSPSSAQGPVHTSSSSSSHVHYTAPQAPVVQHVYPNHGYASASYGYGSTPYGHVYGSTPCGPTVFHTSSPPSVVVCDRPSVVVHTTTHSAGAQRRTVTSTPGPVEFRTASAFATTKRR